MFSVTNQSVRKQCQQFTLNFALNEDDFRYTGCHSLIEKLKNCKRCLPVVSKFAFDWMDNKLYLSIVL